MKEIHVAAVATYALGVVVGAHAAVKITWDMTALSEFGNGAVGFETHE